MLITNHIITHLHSFRNEHTYVFPELQQFAYGSRTYASQLRFRKEQDGFYSGQLAGYIRNCFLVLKILYCAYSAYNQVGTHFLGKVDGQAIVRLYYDARLVPVVVSYHLFALFQGEIRILIFIDADAYDDWKERADGMTFCKVTVSDLIEKNATPEQKAAHIDIADWIIFQIQESRINCTADHLVEAERILQRMIEKNPALQKLIDDLGLVLVGASSIGSGDGNPP